MRSRAVLPLLTCLTLSACSVAPTGSNSAEGNTAGGTAETASSLAAADALLRDRSPASVFGEPGNNGADKSQDRTPSRDKGPDGIWRTLRDGFRLPEPESPAIAEQIDHYTGDPQYLARVAERSRPYLPYIVERIRQRGLPMELALIPVVESAYKPFAYSHGHAAGLWQFVPGTAKHFGLRRDWWYDGRRDTVAATKAALDYFAYLNEFFDGDWLLAIAAYNAGEGTVQRAVRRNERRGEPTDFWHLDLPAQTEAYVPRLLAVRDVVRHPAAHNVSLPEMADRPQVAVVTVDGQIDLALAADLAGISTETLYRLNPGYNRWATPPDGPHRLVVPADRAERFREGLAATAPSERMRWRRHRVARGDTLGEIASKYHTDVSVLRDVNDLNGNLIRVGQELVVPVAGRPEDSGRLARQTGGGGNPPMRHEVQPGDSLWAIARRYDVSVDDLTAWNDLPSNATLQPGETLVVGRGSKVAKTPPVRHTVQSGDSLWTIARRYDVTVDELTAWNDLGANATLHPGQTLVVRRNTGSGGSDRSGSGNHEQRVVYTVRKGDSLYRIAQAFNVRVADLRRWNALDQGEYLQPGQRLKLRVDPTR
ncbi:Cell division suppressor protein YneA [wastewater metagenome]|uniref:Cell division suppressor protein YneA n=2 Tax=unclassified sequences TaxID=12908 RepID=A0A5B8RER9_9ZZZZ|nr:cell division suppressor protein YneA [uncultured organism]